MTLVSVIIPVHDRPDQLKNAVQSVLAQNHKDFEVVIVDDCSSIPVQSFMGNDKRIRVVRHEVNRGAPSARNTGIRNARGNLIAFLDSDDYWLPQKLDQQVDCLNQHPEIDAVTTGFYYNTQEGKSIEIPKKQRDWFRHFCRGMSLSPGTTLMVRKQHMLECLFDEELPRLEDLDWALRFSKEHQFDVIQKILAVVNQGKRPRASAVENANLRIIEKHSRSFLEEGWFFGKQCIGKRYLEIATHYFREGKKNKGFHYLIKALSENPFQRPGMYLRIIDFLIGTSFIKNLKKIRQNLVGKHKHFE